MKNEWMNFANVWDFASSRWYESNIAYIYYENYENHVGFYLIICWKQERIHYGIILKGEKVIKVFPTN